MHTVCKLWKLRTNHPSKRSDQAAIQAAEPKNRRTAETREERKTRLKIKPSRGNVKVLFEQ